MITITITNHHLMITLPDKEVPAAVGVLQHPSLGKPLSFEFRR